MYQAFEIVGTYELDGKQYSNSSCTIKLRNNHFSKMLLINNFYPKEEFKKMQDEKYEKELSYCKNNKLDINETIEETIKRAISYSKIFGEENRKYEREDYNLELDLNYSLDEIKEALLSQFQCIMYREISNFTDYEIVKVPL